MGTCVRHLSILGLLATSPMQGVRDKTIPNPSPCRLPDCRLQAAGATGDKLEQGRGRRTDSATVYPKAGVPMAPWEHKTGRTAGPSPALQGTAGRGKNAVWWQHARETKMR